MLLTSMCLSFASVRDFAFFFSAADASALGAADIGLRPRDGGPQGDRDHADAKLQVCGGARNRTTSHKYAAARAGA